MAKLMHAVICTYLHMQSPPKIIVKQFLDGKHDRKLADIVSTPVATVSKVLKENYYWGCAEMFAGDNNICMKVNCWFKVCWKVLL